MSVFSDITTDINSLMYITTRQQKYLRDAEIFTLGDLLTNIPVEYEYRGQTLPLCQATHHKKALIQVDITAHTYLFLKVKGRLLVITIQDDTATAELHCYGRGFLKNILPVGKNVKIWGTFVLQYNKIISSSFEIIDTSNAATHRLGIVPRYRVPKGFSQLTYSKMMHNVLAHLHVAELHPYKTSQDQHMDRAVAIKNLHAPQSSTVLTQVLQKFAFDEILVFQLFLKTISDSSTHVREMRRTPCTAYTTKLQTLLPFDLTKGQSRAIHTLYDELCSSHYMTTLLQGDVGSGKTIVALFCAIAVIEGGEQVAFAVPSESLAYQHFTRIQKLLHPLGIRCGLLTGSVKAKEREKILRTLQDGSIQLIVGTHALYSKDVQYRNLRFIIVDEQHRFGVMQRAQLIEKGTHELIRPDVLLMSATPIPRSLALTIYGNMSIVNLKERPAIQKPVRTKMIQFDRRKELYNKVKKLLSQNQQAFFIFPQIENEETEKRKSSILSIEELFPEISAAMQPYTCAMLHSKIKEEEKISLIEKFSQGELHVLIATTILEVGIDIPNATIISIFNAEHFGLSTLHQLRGRVGRGHLAGVAVLVFCPPLSDIAKERLKIIYEENDGFVISEKDMQLRGPGDIHQLGLRQSGSLLFQFADIFQNIGQETLKYSLELSNKIMKEDPLLRADKNKRLHALVYTAEHTT